MGSTEKLYIGLEHKYLSVEWGIDDRASLKVNSTAAMQIAWQYVYYVSGWLHFSRMLSGHIKKIQVNCAIIKIIKDSIKPVAT